MDVHATNHIKELYKNVTEKLKEIKDEDTFAKEMNDGYHNEGHNYIGSSCKDGAPEGNSVMSFSEVSARDPIFYRQRSFFDASYHLYSGGMGTARI